MLRTDLSKFRWGNYQCAEWWWRCVSTVSKKVWVLIKFSWWHNSCNSSVWLDGGMSCCPVINPPLFCPAQFQYSTENNIQNYIVILSNKSRPLKKQLFPMSFLHYIHFIWLSSEDRVIVFTFNIVIHFFTNVFVLIQFWRNLALLSRSSPFCLPFVRRVSHFLHLNLEVKICVSVFVLGKKTPALN